MNMPFLEPGDPRIFSPAAPIPVDTITGPETQTLLERLWKVARPEQTDRSKAILVGLAASQIGLPHRIVLVDVAADGHGSVGDLRAYINPVITDRSSEQTEWYEGCYSTRPICGIVSRPNHITLQAYTPAGELVTETHSGYIGRIFQHEIDHLDGRVFIDHISDPEKLHRVENEEYPQYRDQEGWRHWPKKYLRADWERLRTEQSGA